MRIKILTVILFCLIASLSFSQSDSVKTFNFKGKKVFIGKIYRLELAGKSPVYGKLIGINKNSVLIYSDNSLVEFENDDIVSLKVTDGEIPDNSHYTNRPSGIKSKPLYSLSAGYSQKYSEDHNSSYYYSDAYASFNGFNLQGDMLIQTSDYFGFRVDLNYIHTFGKRISGESYSYTYDSTTHRTETDYSDLNIMTLKSGILFGNIARDNKVCFYLYLGLGMGYAFGGDDVQYSYMTKNNITSVYSYTQKSYNEFSIGAHGSIRLSYKISKNYSLFIEPSFQYWSNNIERIINANGGIEFHL